MFAPCHSRCQESQRSAMLFIQQLTLVLLSALLASAATPTRTVTARLSVPPPSAFVSTDANGNFMVNGRSVVFFVLQFPVVCLRSFYSQFTFIGTNAYWLPTLNSDEDIDNTLGNMSAAGIKVVRVWAFNGEQSNCGVWSLLILISIRCYHNPRERHLVPINR